MANPVSPILFHKISIAPMVDRTDRHFRYFCRLFTKYTLLYTEMITAQAILNSQAGKLLDFHQIEKPIALQIAGCDPDEIYRAVKIAEDWDYDEINLNAGCPSDRVSGNKMGAVLMAYPEVVAEMITAIRKATNKPVTLKHRIGIEGKNVLPGSFERTLFDRYEDMSSFISIVEKARVDRFIIHARIAILEGLSPRDNREIPPLRYEEVYRLKKEFPHLNIEINGGIKTLEEIREHLEHVDGVMVGRAAYENPSLMAGFDNLIKERQIKSITRREIIQGIIEYTSDMEDKGFSRNSILRHTLGLFHGKKGSSIWKQTITPPWKPGKNTAELLTGALNCIPGEVLDEDLEG